MADGKIEKKIKNNRRLSSDGNDELQYRYNDYYGKIRPARRNLRYEEPDTIVISTWAGRTFRNSLWVRIFGYKESVVLDSNTIEALAKEIRRIRRTNGKPIYFRWGEK